MFLAVDVGGTKTLISEVTDDGTIADSIKIKTPADYHLFVDEVAKSVDKLSTANFQKACVAIPGKIARKNGVGLTFGNLPWENVPIQADFERIFHCPVIVENDANLAGLGEAQFVDPALRKVLYITVSTGIGAAFVVDNRLEPNALDAEIGHMLVEHRGKLERWEHFASGSAIVRNYGKRASEIEDQQTWYKIAHNLAGGFLTAIAIYTPDVIVVGGGVGTHLDKFKDKLLELLEIYDNPMISIPVIEKAKHPEEAVIYGCYQLIQQSYEKTTS